VALRQGSLGIRRTPPSTARAASRAAVMVFGVCLLVACAVPARAPAGDRAHEADAAKTTLRSFVGDWAYLQSCGWNHSASLRLESAANGGIRGTWSDGTRVRGDHGEVSGEWRDGKLVLRFCRDSEGEGADVCPRFGPATDYVQPRGETLVWFRGFGDGHREYLTLQRSVPGRAVVPDSDCPEAD